MKLETKITERDKKLLSLLGIFLVVVGFLLLVILPGMERSSALQGELLLANQTKQDMEMKLQLLPTVQKSLADAEKTWEELSDSLYSKMGSQEIDRIVTGDVLACGLATKNLSITMNESPVTLEPYIKTDETETLAESGTEAAASEETANGLSSASVDLAVEGSPAQMQSFIDRVSAQYHSVRVTGMDYDLREDLNAQGVKQGDKVLMNIQMDFYMYEK